MAIETSSTVTSPFDETEKSHSVPLKQIGDDSTSGSKRNETNRQTFAYTEKG